MKWFEVDKAGLAALLERRGKQFVIHELVQNAWDENTKVVHISLIRGERSLARLVELRVEDDSPEGFKDLTHIFTLFADSAKKTDAQKRGRFNLGEKLVLALCETATITTTTGCVFFDANGRHNRRARTEFGSVFWGMIKMTREEEEACIAAVHQLIPPAGVETFFNGKALPHRKPEAGVAASLPTEIAGPDGRLRPTYRVTGVDFYEPLPGETAWLYEMGIPVVETGDRWHINVHQKVPLNMDRDNVTPAYLARVRALVAETMHAELTPEDANAPWVRDAVEHHGDKMAPEVIESIVGLRFGDKRVSYDPSDPEANSLAVSQGYAVVHGGQMSRAEWDAARRAGAILPAGQVTPSPKPFHPGGRPLKVLPEDKWTPEIRAFVDCAKAVASELIGHRISVRVANDFGWPFAGAYGDRSLTVNVGRLGYDWFASGPAKINEFLIHELGHEYSCDHLSSEYHDALCRLGGQLSALALRRPELFGPLKEARDADAR